MKAGSFFSKFQSATGSRPGLRLPVQTNHAQRGIALVITLILLAVITFMAVTFLVLSRNEKGSVTTTTDQANAELAAEAGQVQAQTRLLAMIMGYNNPYNFDLMVSTNYARPGGYIPGLLSPTNVNYDYTFNGRPFQPDDLQRNIANLLYDPRPPVYIANPLNGNTDFRYYIDLNRNQKFDPSGRLLVYTNGRPVIGPFGPVTNNFVGDPQWIGLLSHTAFPPGTDFNALNRGFPPGYAHSATNKFISRYAYMVVPSGNALDINYIHNYAKRLDVSMYRGDCFLRDQGLGSFEINLASFLADLNTNQWPSYDYNQYLYNWRDPAVPNYGVAFDDAVSLLSYRYNGSYYNLSNVTAVFGTWGAKAFTHDFLNGYLRTPVMTGIWPQPIGTFPGGGDRDTPLVNNTPWPGADNPNHFFTSQDLFDYTKNSSAFYSRLINSGAYSVTNDTYNANTFYRLLSQLDGDSVPEQDQINLNYVNVDRANNIVSDLATNFVQWLPEQFFTNVANKLVTNFFGTNRIYGFANPFYPTNINIAHIPIYPTNYYTPSVHRLLQLAANIYDATRLTADAATNVRPVVALPSVFRPIFATNGATLGGLPEIFIAGYKEVTNSFEIIGSGSPKFPAPAMLDPYATNFVAQFVQHQRDPIPPMVYGVPLVIGAKKGLPNFNEFAMQTLIQVTRKLEFARSRPRYALPDITNQMYVVTISNVFGMEGWNSYSNDFPHNLSVLATEITRLQVTNEFNAEVLPGASEYTAAFSTNYVINASGLNAWHGYTDPNHASISFQIPMMRNFMPLPNSTYSQAARRFGPLTGRFEPGQKFYVPHWWLNLNTRLLFVLVDTSVFPNRIVDYVNLDAWENTLDLTDKLTDGGSCGDFYTPNGNDGSMWCTNRMHGALDISVPTYGVLNQIGVGLGNITPTYWSSFVQMSPPGQDRGAAIDFFRAQFGFGPMFNPGTTYARSNTFYAPFVPVRNIYLSTTWQANDPLVHYTVGDLQDVNRTNKVDFFPPNPLLENIGKINTRYEPWGGNPFTRSTSDTQYQLAVKDPLVTRSDDWQFPTNKFPNIGWLGRVHRGTPWQTVYLKSPQIDLATWIKWTGNALVVTNMVGTNSQFAGPPGQRNLYGIYDAQFTHPVMDRYILDLFTTAFNENAARGHMSINQTNLAAWSAILGGVIALTNSTTDKDFAKNPFLVPTVQPLEIRPAGIYNPFVTNQWPAIVRLVTAINAVRATNVINPDPVYWSQHANQYAQYQYLRSRPFFSRLGELLEVPELSVASPFLDTANATVVRKGINDAAYERLPQQVLGLLKADPVPRFTIYSWGQSLKPADRSIVTGGPFFGMCTNYQITAEVATRAVVRVDGIPIHPQALTDPPQFKNLRLVIENYNLLPPD